MNKRPGDHECVTLTGELNKKAGVAMTVSISHREVEQAGKWWAGGHECMNSHRGVEKEGLWQ